MTVHEGGLSTPSRTSSVAGGVIAQSGQSGLAGTETTTSDTQGPMAIHCGTKPGHFETSNHSLSHENEREKSRRMRGRRVGE